MKIMNKLLLGGCLLIACFQVQADVYTDFFSQTWGNLQEELSTAKESDKKGIFLFFEMEECPFCARMKETIFSQKAVQEAFTKDFMAIPIDIEGDTEITDFNGQTMTSKEFAQKLHRVRATPVMMFFDVEGQKLYRHTGPTKNAQEFLWMGKYISEGAYKTMRFRAYRKQQQQ